MAYPQSANFDRISVDDALPSKAPSPGHAPTGRRETLLFACLLAVVVVAIWVDRGGKLWPTESAPATKSGEKPMGPGLAALDAADKEPFIGKSFQITNVPMQRKINNQFFWIGRNSQMPMLVVLSSNQNLTNVSSFNTGSLVDVAGTMEKAPPTTEAASAWPLGEPELGQLEMEGAYVRATKLNVR